MSQATRMIVAAAILLCGCTQYRAGSALRLNADLKANNTRLAHFRKQLHELEANPAATATEKDLLHVQVDNLTKAHLDQLDAAMAAAGAPGHAGACTSKYQRPYVGLLVSSAILSFLTGASGISTLGFKDNADGSKSNGEWGVSISSLVLGAAAAGTGVASGFYATLYSDDCNSQ